ncbi:endolytic transglycosylase MltG [Shewanella intestini]|uniref:Endolytic murein transglycosylase n=1 Tax=Shewanella intestini TaxID=2017544 RepID=A0ABS5I368_9GAMM|nr:MULTISPECIES: endolytic transglycosylase MltG [Shewanella]MBR9727840.1 endolytic transglycosylase MltG [Shewanella intestini]MRG36167.1 endolytic transglycosylase MltG [Shewanella sp. XMDDZSB0408]
MTKLFLKIFTALISIITITLIVGYWFMQQLLIYPQQHVNLTSSTTITVARGNTAIGIVHKLEKQGLISDAWKFKYLVKIEPQWAQIKTGLYDVFPSDTLADVLQRINRGEEKSFALTLIEGKTIKEWLHTLSTTPQLSFSDDVFNQILIENGDDSGLPEGKFLPETYHYHAGDTAKAVLSRSYKMMQQDLQQAWQNRDADLRLKSPYELLIIASIIEKETSQATERNWVAAVFNNRLKKGMRLQTDPTVIYGMGERYKGNITRKDLREKTAFNTYRINGLPPTPIAAPSKASLFAAANPAKVDYLYFVSRNDGTHVFSTNLRDHNNAVNKYQRNQK